MKSCTYKIRGGVADDKKTCSISMFASLSACLDVDKQNYEFLFPQSAEAARNGGDLVFLVPLKGCEVSR